MKGDFIVKKCKSEKGKDYFTLGVNLGYRVVNLTFDIATIVEVSHLTFENLYNLEYDTPYEFTLND